MSVIWFVRSRRGGSRVCCSEILGGLLSFVRGGGSGDVGKGVGVYLLRNVG